jgi:IclR family acetate operon transcriptional repressor
MVVHPSTSRNAGGTQIQVIGRATRLLRLMGTAPEPMRLRDLARQAELTPSTTRRILASLVENGLCQQGPDGNYRLGLLLFELGSRVQAGFDLRLRARPALERLSALTQLTVFLCVRNEQRVTAIERVDGRYAFSLALTVGGSLPLHAGAAPRVLLAYDDEADVRRHLSDEAPLERFTDRTLVETDEILADLRETRKRGYVVSEEDVTPGVAAIGAPIFGHDGAGKPVAAISIAGLLPQLLGDERERILALLLEAAQLISQDLGHGLAASESPSARARSHAA